MGRKVKIIITDLDGVIRHFPVERNTAIETAYLLPPGTLLRIAFEPEQLKRVITGEMQDDEWRESIAERLAREFPASNAVAAVREWSDFAGLIDHQVLSYLESMCKGRKLVLLTNATSRLKADLLRAGIRDRFAHILNSSELGLAKPAQEVFLLACGLLQARPEEVAFLDDSRTNVSAAREVGLRSFHFSGLEKLRSDWGAFFP